jgi:hypothetical protein
LQYRFPGQRVTEADRDAIGAEQQGVHATGQAGRDHPSALSRHGGEQLPVEIPAQDGGGLDHQAFCLREAVQALSYGVSE